MTLTTAGAAAPLLIAGIATSSVGAGTNIGTSMVERVITSKQIKEMTGAISVDKELTLKIESQIDDLRRYKDSIHLGALIGTMEAVLGSNHIIVAILHSLFRYCKVNFLNSYVGYSTLRYRIAMLPRLFILGFFQKKIK